MPVRRRLVAAGIVVTALSLLMGPAWAQPTSAPSSTSSTTASTSTSTTVARTTTSARGTTTTSSTTTTTTAPASTGNGESGLSDTALLLLAAVIVVLLLILLVILLMRRRAHDQWRADARAAVGEARRLMQVVMRGLATLDQPAAAAQTWAEVESLGADLHTRFAALLVKPPDPAVGGAVSAADRSLQALRAAVESDRTLHLGPPAPTEAQLSYSGAVVRERATELDQAVDELSARLTTR